MLQSVQPDRHVNTRPGSATRRAPDRGALRQGGCSSARLSGHLASCRPLSRLAHRITKPPPTRATAAGSAASPSSVVFSPLDQLATAVTVTVPVVPASRSTSPVKRLWWCPKWPDGSPVVSPFSVYETSTVPSSPLLADSTM